MLPDQYVPIGPKLNSKHIYITLDNQSKAQDNIKTILAQVLMSFIIIIIILM